MGEEVGKKILEVKGFVVFLATLVLESPETKNERALSEDLKRGEIRKKSRGIRNGFRA